MIYVYTDGASRNNPGKSASGYLILDEGLEVLCKASFYNGIRTNNQAEYLAIVAALEKVLEMFGEKSEIHLRSDSQVVVNQLNGSYKVREADLKELHKKARGLTARLGRCVLESVPRENRYISMVDRDLNRLLDELADKQ